VFTVYFDELSIQLGSARVDLGCTVGITSANLLMFGDDLWVLFRPNISGLLDLLNICDGYVDEHETAFHCKKIICVGYLFAQKCLNNLLHRMFF